MLIERAIFAEVLQHVGKKQATVITGIRRCGKTTLVKMLMSHIDSGNKLYLDLEVISNRIFFEEENYENIALKLKNIYGLDLNSKAYIALDEIQFVKNIPSIVKYFYDHYDIKFILTGSSSYYLKNLFSESLAGRKKIFELYTLDFNEFLKFKKVYSDAEDFWKRNYSYDSYIRLKEYYEEYILYGGFPEVVLSFDIRQKEDILKDILDSYIRIDIKNLSDFESHSSIYRIIRSLSSRVANKLDMTKIANISNVSRATVSNYIELFEGTYLFKRIPVVSRNPEREIVKAAKLYMHDNGLLNTLADVSGGVKFENSVFNQLKHFGDLSYYSLKTGQEIDFILDGKKAFEVKEHGDEHEYIRLKKLSANLEINFGNVIFRYPNARISEYKGNFLWGGDIR
jgi:uncharacterized protein